MRCLKSTSGTEKELKILRFVICLPHIMALGSRMQSSMNLVFAELGKGLALHVIQ